MKTTRDTAEGKVKQLLKEAFSGAKVYQGGGTELVGNSLQEMILEAANNSLQRLYPKFGTADHPAWDRVYSRLSRVHPIPWLRLEILVMPPTTLFVKT